MRDRVGALPVHLSNHGLFFFLWEGKYNTGDVLRSMLFNVIVINQLVFLLTLHFPEFIHIAYWHSSAAQHHVSHAIPER